MKKKEKRTYSIPFNKRLHMYRISALLIAIVTLVALVTMPTYLPNDEAAPLYTQKELSKNLTKSELKEYQALSVSVASLSRNELIKRLDNLKMYSRKVIDLSSSKINLYESQLEKANRNEQLKIVAISIGLGLMIVLVGETVFHFNLFI